MKNLQRLVLWTRFGLVSAFFIAITIELGLGVITIGDYFSFLNIHENIDISVWKSIFGFSLVMLEIVVTEVMYKKKLEYVSLFESLEEKLKYFGRAFSFKILFGSLAGIMALLGYSITHNILWLLPWIMVLYTLSKTFPFKWTLIHAMGIEKEEDKELF